MKTAKLTRAIDRNRIRNEPALAYFIAEPRLNVGVSRNEKVYVSDSGDYPGEQFITVLMPDDTNRHDMSVDALGAYVRVKQYLEELGYEIETDD